MTQDPRRPCAGAQDGFTLVELLVAMAVSIILLLATLGTLDAFNSSSSRQSRLIDANDQARLTMDRTVHDLRNGSTVLRALPNDLEYAVNDSPTITRYVRLCLDASSGLRREQSTSSSAPGNSCPTIVGGWTGGKITTMASTNTTASPLFRYDSATAATAPGTVRSVGLSFSLDASGGGRSAASTLQASAFLRSQAERAPIVDDGDIQATCTPSGPLLNFGLLSNLINGPVTVVANGLVPSGNALQLTNGVTTVTATITNALGLTTVVNKDVKCN